MDEAFPLILADPPWVPQADVGRFPEDPVSAIDGGREGLDVARECLGLIGVHLVAEGCGLLQLGSVRQVDDLEPDLTTAGLRVLDIRVFGAHGMLALLSRN